MNHSSPSTFEDRRQAGRMLGSRLHAYQGADAIVIALPRGGVPVAAEIARALVLPLDVVLVRKVGAPGQPELAVGAVTDGDGLKVTINRDVAEALGLTDAEIATLAKKQLPEIERRQRFYRDTAPPPDLAGRTVIVVDDGVATGATMRSALRLIRQSGPAGIVVALPVAPAETVQALQADADEVICLSTPEHFYAVGAYYLDFDQVPDEEVKRLLDEHRQQSGPGPVH